MTPDEAELRVPRYFRREREKEIETRRKFIEDTLRNLGELEEQPGKKSMTELEAIRLIQVRLSDNSFSTLVFLYLIKINVISTGPRARKTGAREVPIYERDSGNERKINN